MSQQRTRKKRLLWVRYAVALAALFYLFWAGDLMGVLTSMPPIGYRVTGLLCVLVLCGSLAEATGMSISLRAFGAHLTPLRAMMLMLQIRFYSTIAPGVVSTGMKIYRLGNRTQKPLESLGGLAVNRAIFVAALLLLGAIAVPLDREFPWPAIQQAMPIVLVTVALALSLALLAPVRGWLSRCVDNAAARFSAYAPQTLAKKLARLTFHLRRMTWRQLSGIAASCLAAHVMGSVGLLMLANAVELDIPPAVVFWIRAAIMLVTMIPISIAGFGVREISVVALLSQYGITQPDALGFSMLFVCFFVLFRALVGFILEMLEAGYTHWRADTVNALEARRR